MRSSTDMASPSSSRTLFLAWQDAASRRWYTVGRLDYDGATYRYRYTPEAKKAQEDAGFDGVISFPDLDRCYESREIFPLFANQVLSEKRPEYEDYLEWLALPETEADPVAILARTSERVSNTLEIYPLPEEENGTLDVHFFVRGTRHQSSAAQKRIHDLEPGERLRLLLDVQNDFDADACLLRTNEQFEGDMHLVGYAPRYLASAFRRIGATDPHDIVIHVARVNPAPTPVHFRLLCKARLPAECAPLFHPDAHRPLRSEEPTSDAESIPETR